MGERRWRGRRVKRSTVWGQRYEQMPLELLPIPFALTDFGRAYLEQLRSSESGFGLELRRVQDHSIEQVPAEGESRGHQPREPEH